MTWKVLNGKDQEDASAAEWDIRLFTKTCPSVEDFQV
jgi:hypothetical protein